MNEIDQLMEQCGAVANELEPAVKAVLMDSSKKMKVQKNVVQLLW